MKNVLLVEDDLEFGNQCVKLLLDNHFEVSFSENPEKAKLEILDSKFDIVIIDLMLPPTFGVEGLDLFKYIKGLGSNTKVIFVTAKDRGTTEIVAEAMKLGAKNFLDKHNPLFFDKLLVTLKEIADTKDGFDSLQTELADLGKRESEKEVYISYSWGGNSEEIVNLLDETLQKKGVTIIRDKRDLGYKGRIREFMERIGRGKFVIVVISHKYLKSPNCMFELIQIAKNKQFYDRVFPIVLDDADIYDPVERIEYIAYWEEKIKKLDMAMKRVNSAQLQGLREEIDSYTEIRHTISELIYILKDMNTLTPDMHRESSFKELLEAIESRTVE